MILNENHPKAAQGKQPVTGPVLCRGLASLAANPHCHPRCAGMVWPTYRIANGS